MFVRHFTIAVFVLLSLGVFPQDFVVSPAGNDAWSGKLNAPNADKTDGPFATVSRAQKAARTLRAAEPARKTPITIQLNSGLYTLSETIVLSAEDSGSAESPLVFAAAPGETPIISGGVRLRGFKVENGRWTLQIPDVQGGKWSFCQLFVNGQRRFRPRLPKVGYFQIADAVPPAKDAKGWDRFKFKPGDVLSTWKNLDNVEVLSFHNWYMSRIPIGSIDTANNLLVLNNPTPNREHYSGLHKGQRYIIENVEEALQPGQFYLDRKTGVLSYLPLPGEELDKTEIIAPRVEKLLQIKGDLKQKKFVEHIRFDGITFQHSNWQVPSKGYAFAQAEAILSGAISAEATRNCAIENCRVTQVGTYAIELGIGCKNNRIDNCELTDLGAGGVKIGEMGRRDNDDEVASHNSVTNCLIAFGGRVHPAGIGVWIGSAHDNTVEHNEIYDFYYTGVSVGWSWGYGKSNAHHNNISFNHIHKIGQGVLTDMGGIYTLGISTGTVLRNNLIHDIESHSYGGWGIYFDEGSTDVLAENNIVYRTKSSGFHQHYGKENRVLNNIFAFGREAQLMRTRDEKHKSFTLESNIVLFENAPLLGSNWNGDTTKFTLDKNLYWNGGKDKIKFAGGSFEDWQKRGHDVNSMIADPLFTDPAKDAFTLKPESPAFKLGFKPIDLSRIGRKSGKSKLTDLPRAYPHPSGK